MQSSSRKQHVRNSGHHSNLGSRGVGHSSSRAARHSFSENTGTPVGATVGTPVGATVGRTTARDSRETEERSVVELIRTTLSRTRKNKKKNLGQAKSPLRFTNTYRKTPASIDSVSEKRALRRVIARDLTDRERLKEVLAQIERTRALPKTSSYAKHKLAILGKAKELLEEKIEKRGGERAGHGDCESELETLLRELRID